MKPSLKCVMILSTKSAGSSVLQRLIRLGGARQLEHTRHIENETLYWVKAAATLGLPQIELPDSELPFGERRARMELEELLRQNLPGFTLPQDSRALVFDGWHKLCEHYAPVFVEKSPHHAHQWSALELIAQAVREQPDIDYRFVALVRNPMDVLHSAWSRWRTNPHVLQHHWKLAYENLLRWRALVGDRIFFVRYEDFSAGSGTTARLFEFLGLGQPSAEARELIHGNSRCKWKHDRRFGFQLHESVVEAAMSLGYSRSELENSPKRGWTSYRILTRALHRGVILPARRTRRFVRRSLALPLGLRERTLRIQPEKAPK